MTLTCGVDDGRKAAGAADRDVRAGDVISLSNNRCWRGRIFRAVSLICLRLEDLITEYSAPEK